MADTSRFVVIARDGLRLRSGASQDAGVIRTIPEGTVVNVLSREGTFALVDLEGDGKADGFMSLPFLRRSTRERRRLPLRVLATSPAWSHRTW